MNEPKRGKPRSTSAPSVPRIGTDGRRCQHRLTALVRGREGMTKPDPIAIAKAELSDAIAQRDLAQQNLNAAQAAMQQAQANANAAQAMISTAGGAVQQCEAFLKLLEPKPEPPKEDQAVIGALLSRIRSQETPRLNPRARDRFPGQVYNQQQRRLQGERKFRDWDGWLELL